MRLVAPRILRLVVIMSKKLRVPILLFLLFIVVMLFLSGFLTGQVHHEFENPYSRTRKIVETQYGFTRDNVIASPEMEAIYYDELKQPRTEKWVRRQDSYTIGRFTWTKVYETGEVAPVTFVDAKIEGDFLKYVKHSPRTKLALIQSLHMDRKTGTDLESIEHNARLLKIEAARAKAIIHWNEYVRNDTTIMAERWWNDNASRFGMNPDGSPLAETVAIENTAAKKKE